MPGWSDAPQTPKFFRVALLRKLRACQQVAAVCYRVRETGIEFLLVRTRGSGRWTFPKGGAEPGLTHAQAAALEAFEEAGVHGRMEESSFTHYLARKRSTTRPAAKRSKTASGRSSEKDIPVNAHLCEVTRLSTPEESNRNPTWFSAKKAKLRLRDDRSPEEGSELARVVDRAVSRIHRLSTPAPTIEGILLREGRRLASQFDASKLGAAKKDALQKVRFIDDGRRVALRGKASGLEGTR